MIYLNISKISFEFVLMPHAMDYRAVDGGEVALSFDFVVVEGAFEQFSIR